MFSYVRFFLENVKMKKKKPHIDIIDGLFSLSFLNIYLFLFNVSTVELNKICHLQFEAVLPEQGTVGLNGFRSDPVEEVCRQSLLVRTLNVRTWSNILSRLFNLFKKKTVLCHSCVSIRFISHSGSFEYWSVLDSDFGGWVLDTPGHA